MPYWRIDAPVLVFAGEQDIVCEFKHTQELYRKIVAPEKKIHTFPEGLHSPHTDSEYNEWANVLDNWCESKLKSYKVGSQCKKTT